MSFPSSPSQDTVDVSSKTRIGFISHVLPHMFCYFVMALLAITPQTRTLRIALFPVIMLLALRAVVPVDVLVNFSERRSRHHLVVSIHFDTRKILIVHQFWIFLTTARALGWAIARKPLVRQLRPVNSTPSTLMDALDLVSNFRGYGWDWSGGVHIPRETRPSNRAGFILHITLSAAASAFAYGILTTAIRSFSAASSETLSCGPTICFSVELGDIPAGSIFDQSLPFYLRFLRSNVITVLTWVWGYVGFQWRYDLCTLFGVLVLRQDPTQWPPFFDAPWRATSVTHFWGRRWHQWLRKTFLILGGYPLSFIFGRVGIVLGAFFVSALFHHIGLIILNSKSEFWRMLVGFGMMGVVILIEDLFKYLTGRMVQGPAGWVWTMGWILLWSNVFTDGSMRAGGFGYSTLVDRVLPLRMLVEYLVTQFDNFLHAISSGPIT